MDQILCKTDIILIPKHTYKCNTLSDVYFEHFQSPPMYLCGIHNFNIKVYSDWTRQRQFDALKGDAPVLKHMLINRSIHISGSFHNLNEQGKIRSAIQISISKIYSKC